LRLSAAIICSTLESFCAAIYLENLELLLRIFSYAIASTAGIWQCSTACVDGCADTRASMLTCGCCFVWEFILLLPEHYLVGYLVISITIFQDVFDTAVDEDNLEYSENGRWPFQQFVDQLIHDMFDPSKPI